MKLYKITRIVKNEPLTSEEKARLNRKVTIAQMTVGLRGVFPYVDIQGKLIYTTPIASILETVDGYIVQTQNATYFLREVVDKNETEFMD